MAKDFVIDEFINGMTQGFFAPRGYFLSAEAAESTAALAASGVNYVALVVDQFLETFASTRIFADNDRTVSDQELEIQIARLHEYGIKVMLKPMIDSYDSIWRGVIRHYTGNQFAEVQGDTVTPWFHSYNSFLRRYAELAENTGCEMLCIACELEGMESQCRQWQNTINMVREAYSGIVTVNINRNLSPSDDNRKWLRDLDLVGLSGYFKVAPRDRSSNLDQMLMGWEEWKKPIREFHEWLGKPLFFAETGTRPLIGAAGITCDFNAGGAGYSEEEQRDYYISMQEAFLDMPWFYGSIWWKWDEHQHRPQYYLPDGNYAGCEPAPATVEAMRRWSEKGKISRPGVYPSK